MSRSKNISVSALRGIRKASNLSNKVVYRTGRILTKVENKSSKMIQKKTGSISGRDSVSIDSFFYHEFPYLFPIHPALPNLGQSPSVTVLVPSLNPRGFYGGIATLLIASATLANKLGYDYRVVQTSGFEKNNSVLRFLKDKGILMDKSRYSTLDVSSRNVDRFAYMPLHPDDIVVVSAWWDARTASLLPLNRKFVYMIQDYEPIFYNNGDEQQFAESTYFTDNFIPLCNTKLMYKYFSEGNYEYIKSNASWFEPAVGIKNDAKKKAGRRKTLFLYGRPSVHRNMFFSAIRAVDLAFQNNIFDAKEWDIFCAGQEDIPNIALKSGTTIKNLGKMNMNDYYEFSKRVDISLTPMLAPHPNYPTLELASLGSIVVTTRYKTKQSLENYSENILVCEPTIEDMSRKLVHACSLLNNNAATTKNNISFNWSEVLDEPLNEVIRRL